jgi:hypothetical protein
MTGLSSESPYLKAVLEAVIQLPEDDRQPLIVDNPPADATFDIMQGVTVRLGDAVELLELIKELESLDNSLMHGIVSLPAAESDGDYDYL